MVLFCLCVCVILWYFVSRLLEVQRDDSPSFTKFHPLRWHEFTVAALAAAGADFLIFRRFDTPEIPSAGIGVFCLILPVLFFWGAGSRARWKRMFLLGAMIGLSGAKILYSGLENTSTWLVVWVAGLLVLFAAAGNASRVEFEDAQLKHFLFSSFYAAILRFWTCLTAPFRFLRISRVPFLVSTAVLIPLLCAAVFAGLFLMANPTLRDFFMDWFLALADRFNEMCLFVERFLCEEERILTEIFMVFSLLLAFLGLLAGKTWKKPEEKTACECPPERFQVKLANAGDFSSVCASLPTDGTLGGKTAETEKGEKDAREQKEEKGKEKEEKKEKEAEDVYALSEDVYALSEDVYALSEDVSIRQTPPPRVRESVSKAPEYGFFYAVSRNTLWTVLFLFALNLIFETYTRLTWNPPAGFCFGTYCHQGAAFLTGALTLTAFTLCVIFRGVRKGTISDEQTLRLKRLAYVWLGENFLLACFIFLRLGIYAQQTGLTWPRVVGFFGTSAVTVGLFWTGAMIRRRQSEKWLAGRLCWTGLFLVWLYLVLPVDAMVWRFNTNQILAGNHGPLIHISRQWISEEGWLQMMPLLASENLTVRHGFAVELRESVSTNFWNTSAKKDRFRDWRGYSYVRASLYEQCEFYRPWILNGKGGKKEFEIYAENCYR